MKPGPHFTMTLPHDILSRFAHDCYQPPRAGASDCPACRWVREQIAAEVVRSSGVNTKYLDCEIYQIGMKELGLAV